MMTKLKDNEDEKIDNDDCKGMLVSSRASSMKRIMEMKVNGNDDTLEDDRYKKRRSGATRRVIIKSRKWLRKFLFTIIIIVMKEEEEIRKTVDILQ